MTQYRVPELSTFPWQQSVKGQQSAPPGSPAKGDRYVVTPTGSGAWSGHDNSIAWCSSATGPIWSFDAPVAGWQIFDSNLNQSYYYDGSSWVVAYPWDSAFAPLANIILNGDFDIFQRTAPGTLTSVSNNNYGPDRWKILTQTASVQVQRIGGATGSIASANAGEIKQNQAAAQRFGIIQAVENISSVVLRGQKVTAQCSIRCSNGQPIYIAILEWTGTADAPAIGNVVNSWTSSTYTSGNFFSGTTLTVDGVNTVTPTANTWTTITVSGTVTASCNNLMVFIWTGGTAAQNVTLDFDAAGLYIGKFSLAPIWVPRPYSMEITLCQRFFEKSYAIDIPPGTTTSVNSLMGLIYSTGLVYVPQVQYRTLKLLSVQPTMYSTYDGASGNVNELNISNVHQVNIPISFNTYNLSNFQWYATSANFTTTDYAQYQWAVDADF